MFTKKVTSLIIFLILAQTCFCQNQNMYCYKVDTVSNHFPVWEFKKASLYPESYILLDSICNTIIKENSYIYIEYLEPFSLDYSYFLTAPRKKTIQDYIKRKQIEDRVIGMRFDLVDKAILNKVEFMLGYNLKIFFYKKL
jgi:hypothetical protein